MAIFKIRRHKRIVRHTTSGGLILIQQQFIKYAPFKTILHPLFQKRFGLSILSLWLIMIYRSLLGGLSFQQFQIDWNKDSTKGILAHYREKITHRLLARNIHKFSPQINRKVVMETAKSLFNNNLLTANRIAIDSTSILVSGKNYPKVGSITRNGKYQTGYKLSIAFDIDAKIPLAYILTPLNVHDCNLLIPLIKMVQNNFQNKLKVIVLDRGYYGVEFFKFLRSINVKFFIPVKKFSAFKNKLIDLKKDHFIFSKKLNLFYKDDILNIQKYGNLRCIFVMSKDFKDWMPLEEKSKEVWAILTNDFDMSPNRILKTYRDRWQIEVFFKQCKGELGLNRFPGRDYRIINMHIATVLLGYICITSLVLEEKLNNEEIKISLKDWINTYIYLVLTIILKGNFIFLEFQEKWVSISKSMENYLNGGFLM